MSITYKISNKKGVFHTIDALLATMIIVSLLIFSSTFFAEEKPRQSTEYLSQDLSNALSNLRIGEIESPYIQQLINNSEITDTNNTVLEQVGIFWAERKTNIARNITETVLEGFLYDNIGISISFDDEEIFLKNKTADTEGIGQLLTIRGSKKMISGISSGLPVTGISSRVYLQSIKLKTTSKYIFFGGFEGQGTITKTISLLDDALLKSIELELDAGSEFDIYINNNQCQSRFFPGFKNMSADYWNISSCNAFVIPGQNIINNFTIVFPAENINSAYVGGGYIKITYTTESMFEDLDTSSTRHTLPGIDGIVNTYSSFYVPGNINSMTLFLHYFANHSISNSTFYLNIGNKTIYNDKNTTEEQVITLDNTTLASILDYNELSQTTVPFRIGFENLSYVSQEVGNADVVLITDLSGSMEWCLDGSYVYRDNNNCRGCTSTGGDNPCRIELARELDKEFISLMLEGQGNRVGLVTYSLNGDTRHMLSDNNESLQGTVDNFPEPTGGTCIGCAIRAARLILEAQSNSSRNQYIIVMTDGIGNIRTYDYTINPDRTTCCTQGYCVRPTCGNGLYWSGVCSDYLDNTAKSRAIDDTCYARTETNATIHSVGFGAGAQGCVYAVDFLEQVAICGNGSMYSSTNVSGLRDIYETIANDLVTVSRVSQLVEVQGNPISSILYPDSFIELNYSRDFDPFDYGQISLNFDVSSFTSCSPSFEIPQQLTVANAWATSYSSEHWTDLINANDNAVFSLEAYSQDYSTMGDPFVVQVPESLVVGGSNTLLFRTGDSPLNSTGCSLNNTFIYTGMISSSTAHTGTYALADGCNWFIEFDDGTVDIIPAPVEYAGSNNCSYTSANVSYNSADAADVAMFSLLQLFDLDDDQRSDINFEDNDLVIVFTSIGEIPFMWGPAIVEVNVWQ